MGMKKSNFTESQIIGILNGQESGKSVAGVLNSSLSRRANLSRTAIWSASTEATARKYWMLFVLPALGKLRCCQRPGCGYTTIKGLTRHLDTSRQWIFYTGIRKSTTSRLCKKMESLNGKLYLRTLLFEGSFQSGSAFTCFTPLFSATILN